MEPGYITLIILFCISQATLIIIVAVLIISRNRAVERLEQLRSETYEQYRKYSEIIEYFR